MGAGRTEPTRILDPPPRAAASWGADDITTSQAVSEEPRVLLATRGARAEPGRKLLLSDPQAGLPQRPLRA